MTVSRKSKARNTIELSVSITPEIDDALRVATEFQGMKSSQLCRQALLVYLVSGGYMEHPLKKAQQQRAAVNGKLWHDPAQVGL